jgi:hypothetical protein
MKRTGMMILVALAVSAPAASAVAQNCGWGGWYGGYSSYSREYIPYFSQHPPVYYSYPVPRTYGWSPYAYPPGTMTPELELQAAPAPTSFRNPFYKPEGKTESTASTDSQGSTAALRIVNPFVAGAADRPAAKLAKVVTNK